MKDSIILVASVCDNACEYVWAVSRITQEQFAKYQRFAEVVSAEELFCVTAFDGTTKVYHDLPKLSEDPDVITDDHDEYADSEQCADATPFDLDLLEVVVTSTGVYWQWSLEDDNAVYQTAETSLRDIQNAFDKE